MRLALKFLKSAQGKIGILFDQDPDGICAAAILLGYFKGSAHIVPGKLEKEYFVKFSKMGFEWMFILDLAVDQYLDYITSLKGKRVLFIDHHPVTNDLNKYGFVYLNPRLKKPKSYVSTSRLVYNLTKAKTFRWLMRIGAVGDHEIEGSEIENEAVKTINAVIMLKKESDIAKLVKFLSKCASIENFVYDGKYAKLREMFDKEIEKQIRVYESIAAGEITFFKVKSKYPLTSILSTKLFELYPKRTIIVYRKRSDGYWNVSGRSHKYNIGKLFREASKGLGKGGGHEVAAGARVKSIRSFIRRLKELISVQE